MAFSTDSGGYGDPNVRGKQFDPYDIPTTRPRQPIGRALQDAMNQHPEKMYVQSMEPGLPTLTAQYNPEELKERITASYDRVRVPGLGHEPLQYMNTKNAEYKLSLFFSAIGKLDHHSVLVDMDKVLEDMEYARRYLTAHCYPRGKAGTVHQREPSRVLLVWPNALSLQCVITDLEFTFTEFGLSGKPIAFTVDVTFEEVRDRSITMQDVLQVGTFRAKR